MGQRSGPPSLVVVPTIPPRKSLFSFLVTIAAHLPSRIVTHAPTWPARSGPPTCGFTNGPSSARPPRPNKWPGWRRRPRQPVPPMVQACSRNCNQTEPQSQHSSTSNNIVAALRCASIHVPFRLYVQNVHTFARPSMPLQLRVERAVDRRQRRTLLHEHNHEVRSDYRYRSATLYQICDVHFLF